MLALLRTTRDYRGSVKSKPVEERRVAYASITLSSLSCSSQRNIGRHGSKLRHLAADCLPILRYAHDDNPPLDCPRLARQSLEEQDGPPARFVMSKFRDALV